MKRLLLLVVVFCFVYPIFPKISPIPIDRILQLMGGVLLVFHQKDALKLASSRSTLRFWSLTFVLLCLAFFIQLPIIGQYDTYFIIRVVNVFFEFCSAYLVFSFARWCYKNVTIGTILYYIVLAAVIQTFIATVFYITPSYYVAYYSYLNGDIAHKEFDDTMALLNVRFVGVGSSFFGGTIKYGIAFFSLLIMPYVHHNRLTSNKILYWLALIVIIFGGLMTGRSFFIAIILGITMVTSIRSKNLLFYIANSFKIVILGVLFLPIVYLSSTLFFDVSQFERAFNFAFELFINASEGEGFQSSSTNKQLEMYVFPESTKTWLIGDAKMQNSDGGYYMFTDIGYLRLIYYFGLPATLFFVFVLIKYCKILITLGRSRPLAYFFVVILAWHIILGFKGLAFHSYYFVLFLVVLVLSKERFTKDGIKKIRTD